MRPRQLAGQLFACILIFSLSVGCGLGTSPAAVTPTVSADPLQQAVNAVILNQTPVDEQGVDQAEADVVNRMRAESGARLALGDQADAIFLQMDQAKAQALQSLLDKVSRGSAYAPTSARMLALTGLWNMLGLSAFPAMDYQRESWGAATLVLMASPMLLTNVGRDSNGNAISPPIEASQTTGDATYTSRMDIKLIGSTMEVKLVYTAAVTNPVAYTESATVTLSMNVCPDANGEVPLRFSFLFGNAQSGGGEQWGSENQVTGHVNDEGKLDSYDYQATASGSNQPVQVAGNNAPAAHNYVEIQFHGNQPYANPGLPNDFAVSVSRQSSEITQASIDEIGINLVRMSMSMINGIMSMGEDVWTKGYCLKITVPELEAGIKKVEPGSETRFTANVHHKFENAELPLPVIATLSDGQVSVNPSAVKVPAPADFTYKAEAQDGQSATVNLETRSKRGIAKLDLKFTTGIPAWTGEGTYRKAVTQSYLEVKYAYTFSITFHALPDGKIEGTGTLKMVDWSEAGQGMVCTDPSISSLVYPPMQVTGTFTPAAAGQPGTFHLITDSQSSTNTTSWTCTYLGAMAQQGPPYSDLGPVMGFDIEATDGAQSSGTQDLSGYGGSGSANWTLQIHQQAAP